MCECGLVDGSLRYDPDPLDPTTSGTFVSRIVYVDMCEKLYDVGPKLQIVPQLASALPTVSSDRTTLTIPLRRGVRFNDGTPVLAADVVHSFNTLIGKLAAPQFRTIYAEVKGVTAVDERTVRFDFASPNPELPMRMLLPAPVEMTALLPRLSSTE